MLSPVDRVSELLFGLFMALTFVGAVSVAESGREQIRTMFAAALGCNLAWGLVDAVMYLVRTVTDRGRLLTLVRSVRAAPDAETGRTIIERSLSRVAAGLVSSVEIEAMRGRIVALPSVPARPTLEWNDLLAALAIFLIVVASTFPVVLPFCADPGCRNGEDGIPRHRAGDAVLRRARSRPLRGLRKLEGRVHDDRARHRRSWSRSTRSADERRTAGRRRAGRRHRHAGTRRRGRTRSGRRASPADETIVGIRDHRVSHRRSRRRELHVGDRGSRSRPAAPRGAGTTTSRSVRVRLLSAGPSPAGKRSHGS